MSVADCPKCGRRAESAGQTAYCPDCGWNRTQAAADLRIQLQVLSLIFGALLIVISITWHTARGIAALCVFASLIFAADLVKCLWQIRKLKRRSVIGSELDLPESGEGIAPAATDCVIPRRFRHIPGLVTPRRLRMKRVFRALLSSLAFIAITFAWVCASLILPPHKHPDDPRDGLRLAWIPAGILFAMVWSFLKERRRKKLLRDGNVAFALVKESSAGQSALLPGITYEFQTEVGKPLEDFDQDWTDSFHKGMLVPVFYDSAQPENHVAMCASFYDVL